MIVNEQFDWITGIIFTEKAKYKLITAILCHHNEQTQPILRIPQ